MIISSLPVWDSPLLWSSPPLIIQAATWMVRPKQFQDSVFVVIGVVAARRQLPSLLCSPPLWRALTLTRPNCRTPKTEELSANDKDPHHRNKQHHHTHSLNQIIKQPWKVLSHLDHRRPPPCHRRYYQMSIILSIAKTTNLLGVLLHEIVLMHR